jgi:outer membrane protein
MKIPCSIALLAALSLPIAAQEQPRLLGIALQSDAAYLGAAKERTLLIPLVNWQSGRFFARSTKGIGEAGLRWQLENGFALGSQLALELGRDSDDADLLQQLQMPDIGYGASLGAHLEHSATIGPAPLTTLLRLRQRSGSERGALADIRLELGVFGTDTLGLQTYIQATWGNRRALMSDFGIKPANAAVINMASYAPDTGIRDTVVGLAGKIDLNRKWMVVAAVERKQLRGDAASSPITEQKNTSILTLGSLHRF